MSDARPDNWMPLYIGDYLRDTQRLTTEQHGAYLLLIMDYWTAGPPPDDDEQLAAVAKMNIKDWKRIRARMAKFFQIEEGQWRHKRVEEEMEFAKTLTEFRKEAGRRGGLAKAKQTASKRLANTLANGKQNGTPLPLPSPLETIVSIKEAIVDGEVRKLIADENLTIDPVAELAKFTDWKLAKGRTFRNDRAAFRNWLRKADEIARQNGANAPARSKNPAIPLQTPDQNERYQRELKRWVAAGADPRKWVTDVFGPVPDMARVA